ncbi:Heavy metal-associated isoprenylated plant protein 3 [Ancistrocladus abbreviatus]
MGAEEEKKGEKEKKDAKSITVVLNVNLHCSGCISRIRKVLYSFNGVETVKDEADKNKLTVVGTVDPVKLREQA